MGSTPRDPEEWWKEGIWVFTPILLIIQTAFPPLKVEKTAPPGSCGYRDLLLCSCGAKDPPYGINSGIQRNGGKRRYGYSHKLKGL